MNTIARVAFTATLIAAATTAPVAAWATPTTTTVSASRTSTHPTITSTTTCGELHVSLTGYASKPHSTTVTATLDGTKVVNYAFATTYAFTFYVDNTTDHNVTVHVTPRHGQPTTTVIKMKTCTLAS